MVDLMFRLSWRTLRTQAVHPFSTYVFTNMIIGDHLRALREQKNFSQGEIEKRTGLLRCYISRAENGHTVPAIETLEKFAPALEVSIYQLFYEGEEPPTLPKLPKRKTHGDNAWAIRARTLVCWRSSVTCSAGRRRTI
jgi:transcriptional regulator with XRE-family HTH domain